MREQHNHAKENAVNLREQFLEERASYYATQRNRTMENVLNQIKTTEMAKPVYSKIRHIMHPERMNGISKLYTSVDGNTAK